MSSPHQPQNFPFSNCRKDSKREKLLPLPEAALPHFPTTAFSYCLSLNNLPFTIGKYTKKIQRPAPYLDIPNWKPALFSNFIF
jgi:hypothetical protein